MTAGVFEDIVHDLRVLLRLAKGKKEQPSAVIFDSRTVLTLFNFMSQYSSQWNLLFADVLVITVLPLIMFMFFQRQIVSGMTTGAIKG